MWTINHFGQTFQCNGSIQEAVACNSQLATTVTDAVPYINGSQASMGDQPRPGEVVTFRPRMSGKA